VKTLDTSQNELVARSSLSVIHMVKLTPWDDKGASIEGTPYYISKHACWYDYGNDAENKAFEPWLASIGPIRSSMVHMAGLQGSGVTEKTIDIVLHNSEARGSRVAAILAADTLEGAQVEVSELLTTAALRPPLDLRLVATGDEHTVFFRGVVRRVLINNSTVTLQCATDFPRVEWATILDASTTRPKDVGARFPIPYGKSCLVPLVGYDVSWATSLTQPLPVGSPISVGITDGSGFPDAGSFTIAIGAELLTASKTNDQVLYISARAVGSTQDEPHAAGMPVSEIRSGSKWIVSRYDIASMKQIFYKNPADGKLVRIPTGYTFNKQDTSIIAGEEVSTLEFSTQNQYDLLEFIRTQQQETGTTPTFSEADVYPQASGTSLAAAGYDGDTGTYENIQRSSVGADWKSRTVRFPNNPNMTAARLRFRPGPSVEYWVLYIRKSHSTSGEIILTLGEEEGADTWYDVPTDAITDDYLIHWEHKGITVPASHKDVDLAEIYRVETEQDPPDTYTVPAEIAAATLSVDLDLYAEVDGVAAPGGDVGEYNIWEAYNPESADALTWNTSPTVTIAYNSSIPDGVTGSDSLRLWRQDYDYEFLDGSDAASWTLQNCSLQYQGPTVFTVYPDNTSNRSRFSIYDPGAWGIDLTDNDYGPGHLGIALSTAGGLFSGSATIIVRIGKGDDIDWNEYEILPTGLSEGNVVVFIDRDSTRTDYKNGGWDYTDWDWLEIQWEGAASMTFAKAWEVRETAMAQCNALGGLDFTTSSTYDVWLSGLALYLSEGQMGASDLSIYISDDATVTGTDLPTNHARYDYDTSSAVSGAWTKFSFSGSGTGGSGISDITDINYIRYAFTFTSTATKALIAYGGGGSQAPYYIDVIERIETLAPPPPNPYTALEGEAIELSTDVALHWIKVAGGADIDATTFADSVTNLGSNVLRGDARGWGVTFSEVLDQIAFVSRANFTTEETSTGQVWKMLTAESDYTFGSSVRTLTMFPPDGFMEGGRDEARELASGRTFLYGYQPYLGTGDQAFTQVLRIGPDQNDSGGGVSSATVAAAVSAFGARDGPIEFLLGIHDTATAQDIASWRYTEGARLASVIVIRDLSWSQGYDLECGDIVSVVRPWLSGSIDLRIIEVTKDPNTQRVEVRGVVV